MLSVAHSHRSYLNLKAFQAATHLCADLFWRSRTFPAGLHRSLTSPMRESGCRAYQSILRVWRHRHDTRQLHSHVLVVVDELWMLRQYILRARLEEVLRESEYVEYTSRMDHLQVLVHRLGSGLAAKV